MTDFNKWYIEKGGKSIITTLRYDKELLNEVLELTSFLDSSCTISERVYILVHNIIEEPKCPYCNKKLAFHKLNRGYHGTCQSKECVLKHRSVVNKESSKKINWDESLRKQKETFQQIYGAPHNWCNDTSSRDKYHETMKMLYGMHSPLMVKELHDKQQNTMMDRYGVLGFLHHPKMLETLLERYPDALNELTGNINIMTSKNGHKIWEDAIVKRFGVKNPMQIKEIFDKQQKAGFVLTEFKDTGVFYRGSYEYDFLEKFADTVDIEDPTIVPEYEHDGCMRKYFPDFYIPSRNLIVEIKSKYYYDRDKDTIIKKALSTMRLGYEFIIIIDKDYSYFKKKIKYES